MLFSSANTSTASFETFSKIHHWLWNCNNHHRKCIQHSMEAANVALPRRLIHVGKFASESIVKLIESSDLPASSFDRRYITLSHCWGATAGLKLTSAAYMDFVNGLELHTLPKTFRDAITLTRYLGIDYIWIDCMCIIQHSLSDWESESYKMGQIYRGSFLNIGANAYCNSNGGLFQQRDPYSVTPLRMTLK